MQDCVLLKISEVEQLLQVAPELRDVLNSLVSVRTTAVLSALPFFQHVIRENKPWSKISMVGALFTFSSVAKGDTVLSQGNEPHDKFFVLVSGTVCVKSLPTDAPVNRTDQLFFESVFSSMTVPDRDSPGGAPQLNRVVRGILSFLDVVDCC